jgi:hypothetical protein
MKKNIDDFDPRYEDFKTYLFYREDRDQFKKRFLNFCGLDPNQAPLTAKEIHDQIRDFGYNFDHARDYCYRVSQGRNYCEQNDKLIEKLEKNKT